MVCPLCGYHMEPFDKECRKCHGKGIEKPSAPPHPPAAPEAVPVLRAVPEQAAAAPAAEMASNASLPYFFVARDSVLGKPLFYRVYADRDALLFIEAGTFHLGLIDAVKQMYGETGQGATAFEMVGRTVMTRAVMQGGAAGAAGGLAVGGLMWVVGKNLDNQNRKQADVLDAMTPDALRQKAQTDKSCLYLTPNSASQVVLRPSEKMSLTDSPTMAGYLSFQHQTAGKGAHKWKLCMMSLTDSRFAAQELRRVLGVERVNVRFPF